MERKPIPINVVGVGQVFHPADQGILVFEIISGRQITPDQAKAVVLDAKARIEDRIAPLCIRDEFGYVISNSPIIRYVWSTLGTIDYPSLATRNDSSEPTIIYEARLKTEITFRDVSNLTSIAFEFAISKEVQVSSIDWTLSEASMITAHKDVRLAAGRDAKQKAVLLADDMANAPKEKVRLDSLNELDWTTQYRLPPGRPQVYHESDSQKRNIVQEEIHFEPQDVCLSATFNCVYVIDI